MVFFVVSVLELDSAKIFPTRLSLPYGTNVEEAHVLRTARVSRSRTHPAAETADRDTRKCGSMRAEQGEKAERMQSLSRPQPRAAGMKWGERRKRISSGLCFFRAESSGLFLGPWTEMI